MTRCLPLALLAFLPLIAHAGTTTLSGRVVGIADGDTVTLLDARLRQHRIRLAEIDAPERRQAFGTASRQSLAALCFGQPARVQVQNTDRYGRSVGRLYCNGVDANAAQVRAGMAWVYRRYARDPTLLPLERQARQARRGLWRDAAPIPPWEFRHHGGPRAALAIAPRLVELTYE